MAKESSPFTPGRPVPVEFFVGRSGEIDRMVRSVRQVAQGKQESLFLTGERGIGKSSLAAFVRYIAEKEYAFLSVHVYLGGASSLGELVQRTFERLLQESSSKPVFAKLKALFAEHIKEVGLFGVTVQFSFGKKEAQDVVTSFLPALDRLYEKVQDEQKGLMLVFDDINGMTAHPQFAHFLKSIVDEIATRQKSLPLLLLLTGLPERRDEMIRHQPSIGRIFDVIEIRPFDRTETTEFYTKAFSSEGLPVDADAMDLLCHFSGGLPMLLHEVGDAVFWEDDDNRITRADAMNGIIVAADIVGRKYLDRQVYSAIRSEKYRSILKKIVKPDLTMRFKRGAIAEKLTVSEQKVLGNFLVRMKRLGVMRPGEDRGEYIFANNLFRLYMALQAAGE